MPTYAVNRSTIDAARELRLCANIVREANSALSPIFRGAVSAQEASEILDAVNEITASGSECEGLAENADTIIQSMDAILKEAKLGYKAEAFKMETSDTITAACIIAGAIILVHFLR